MTTLQYSSELMEHYRAGGSVGQIETLAVAHHPEVGPIAFVLRRGQLRLIYRDPGSISGWMDLDMAQGLGGRPKIQQIAITETREGHPILAIAYADERMLGSLMVSFTKDIAPNAKNRWISVGIRPIGIARQLAVDELNTGSVVLDVACTDVSGGSPVEYLIEKPPGHESPAVWNELSVPPNATQDLSFARLRVPGFETQLGVIRQYTAIGGGPGVSSFTPVNTRETRVLPTPDITAMAVGHGLDETDAFFYGKDVIFAAKDWAPISEPLPATLRALNCGSPNALWALVDHDLYLQHIQQNGQWSSLLPVHRKVEQFGVCSNVAGDSHDLFVATTDNRLLHLWRDAGDLVWKTEEVKVSDTSQLTQEHAFMTVMTLTGDDGHALAGHPLTVKAAERIALRLNGAQHMVGPILPLEARTDSAGQIALAIPTANLTVPAIRVEDALGHQWTIHPAGVVQDRLKSYNKDAYRNAQMQTLRWNETVPLWHGQIPDKTINHLDDIRTKAANGHVPEKPWAQETTSRRVTATEGLIGELFEDIWQKIRQGFTAVEDFVWEEVTEGYKLVIHTADGVIHTIVHYADQLWLVMQHIWHDANVGFDRLARWIGHITCWDNVLDWHRVIVHILKLGFNQQINWFDGAQTKVDTWFHNQKDSLMQSFDDSYQWPTHHLSQSTTGSSPKVHWALHLAQNHPEIAQATPKAPLDVRFDGFEDRVKNQITDLETQIKSQLIGPEGKGGILGGWSADNLTVEKMAEDFATILTDDILTGAEDVTNDLINGARMVAAELPDKLQSEWHVPLLTPLYAMLTGDPLTPLDVVALLIALPSTLLYLAEAQEPPISKDEANRLTSQSSWNALLTALKSGQARALKGSGVSPITKVSWAFGYISSSSTLIMGLVSALTRPLKDSGGETVSTALRFWTIGTFLMSTTNWFAGMIMLEVTAPDNPGTTFAVEQAYTFASVTSLILKGFDVLAMVDGRKTLLDATTAVTGCLSSLWGMASLGLAIALLVEELKQEPGHSSEANYITKAAENFIGAADLILSFPILGILVNELDPVVQAAYYTALGMADFVPSILDMVREADNIRNKLAHDVAAGKQTA